MYRLTGARMAWLCLSLFGLTNLVRQGPFPLSRGRICTAGPACQLDNSQTVKWSEAELGGAYRVDHLERERETEREGQTWREILDNSPSTRVRQS